MLVASSASGRVVIGICDGSAAVWVSTAGVQSEQNTLRLASWAPSLVRAATTGVSTRGATGAITGACSGSPRYLASTMWAVALAANTAQIMTTIAPRVPK